MEDWKKTHKVIKTRIMKKFNIDEFRNEVAGIQWDQVFSDTDDRNELVIKWSTALSLIINKTDFVLNFRGFV